MALMEYQYIQIENLTIPYLFRRSKKARRSLITVLPDKIEVVVPPRMSESRVDDFIDEHTDWIYRKYKEVRKKARDQACPLPKRFSNGAKILFRGKEVKLRIWESKTCEEIDVRFKGNIHVTVPRGIKGKSEAVKKAVCEWFKELAKTDVEHYVRKHSEKHGLKVGKIRIKNQKQRWGSCSWDNSININWQLVLFPRKMMEYVVVHELCHIRHRDHSNRFWKFVKDHLPDFEKSRDWLGKYASIAEI